jgi:hypothetical protein
VNFPVLEHWCEVHSSGNGGWQYRTYAVMQQPCRSPIWFVVSLCHFLVAIAQKEAAGTESVALLAGQGFRKPMCVNR